MALPTVFLSGDVFTAANANLLRSNQYNQTVSTKTASYTLVAADAGTRIVMNAGATNTAITVNTSLFAAGDTLMIQNISTSGVCTVTAGTATVSSAGPLAIPTNGSGILYFTSAGVSIFYPSAVTASASGLTLIKTQTIGTTVSSVEVTGAFSATYDNYKIVVSGGVASTNETIDMRLGATATGYYYGTMGSTYSAGTYSGANGNNDTLFGFVGHLSTNAINCNIEINMPFLTKNTVITSLVPTLTTNGQSLCTAGFINNSTSYTAFTLLPRSGATMTGGTIRVYGYANS